MSRSPASVMLPSWNTSSCSNRRLLLGKRYDVHVEPRRLPHQPERHRASENLSPPGLMRASNDDVRHPVRARKVEQALDRIRSAQLDHLGAELARQIDVGRQM